MPSAGGVRFVVEGREGAAEVNDSVRVVRRTGKAAGAAMLGILKPFDAWGDSSGTREGRIFGMAVFPGLAPRFRGRLVSEHISEHGVLHLQGIDLLS